MFGLFEKKPVVRIAPSPTGAMHVGTARTALFNYLFAKQTGGKFYIRIEDTDKERSKKEHEEGILKSFSWLGLEHDGEIVRQSERTELYTKYLEIMIKNGSAYISREQSQKEPGKEIEVVRFKNPNKVVTFKDIIRGDISFDTTELGDFVIAKSLTEPLYHLAVVVDDFDMGITHVIRGEDHISNTPRQILIQEGIDAPRPLYAHIPLILSADRSKLSKRHGATAVPEYEKEGYLPDAMNNFLALIGWHPEGEQEVFSLEELIKLFDLEKVQKGGAVFNKEKLDWVNKEHIKRLSQDELSAIIEKTIPEFVSQTNKDQYARIAPTLTERMVRFGELHDWYGAGELDFYIKAPVIDTAKVVWKTDGGEVTKKHIGEVVRIVEGLSESVFSGAGSLKAEIFPYADLNGRGSVLWPVRYSLSGKDKSPDPFTLMYILGKEETLSRLKAVHSTL